MIHLIAPYALAAVLAGAGVHGILSRRNAVLMLIGVELVLASANLILVTASATMSDALAAGQILTIFIITLAAAEVCVALGIILAAFRASGHIDLTRTVRTNDEVSTDAVPQRPNGVSAR